MREKHWVLKEGRQQSLLSIPTCLGLSSFFCSDLDTRVVMAFWFQPERE